LRLNAILTIYKILLEHEIDRKVNIEDVDKHMYVGFETYDDYNNLYVNKH